MTVFEANAETLQAALDRETPVVIQFWAEWCAPCRAMIPIVEAYAAAHPEMTVARVNIEAHPELSIKYQVIAVPAFVVAQGSTVLGDFTGAMPLPAFAREVSGLLQPE